MTGCVLRRRMHGAIQFVGLLIAVLELLLGAPAAFAQTEGGVARVEPDGTISLPNMAVPYSDLASEAAKHNLLDRARKTEHLGTLPRPASIEAARDQLDSEALIPALQRLRKSFPVDI